MLEEYQSYQYFIEVVAFIFQEHCSLVKNVYFLRVTGTRGRLMHVYKQFSSIHVKYINVVLMD